MISLIITFVVMHAVWLAYEVYCAPVACEGPNGLCLIEPGRRLSDLLPPGFGRVDPPAFWGLG
jgi:hypothetical protein